MISKEERIAIAPVGTVTPRRFCERSWGEWATNWFSFLRVPRWEPKSPQGTFKSSQRWATCFGVGGGRCQETLHIRPIGPDQKSMRILVIPDMSWKSLFHGTMTSPLGQTTWPSEPVWAWNPNILTLLHPETISEVAFSHKKHCATNRNDISGTHTHTDLICTVIYSSNTDTHTHNPYFKAARS